MVEKSGFAPYLAKFDLLDFADRLSKITDKKLYSATGIGETFASKDVFDNAVKNNDALSLVGFALKFYPIYRDYYFSLTDMTDYFFERTMLETSCIYASDYLLGEEWGDDLQQAIFRIKRLSQNGNYFPIEFATETSEYCEDDIKNYHLIYADNNGNIEVVE